MVVNDGMSRGIGLMLVLSPRLAVCAELFTVSRKQHLFAVSVADLTREADSCLFLKTQHSV